MCYLNSTYKYIPTLRIQLSLNHQRHVNHSANTLITIDFRLQFFKSDQLAAIQLAAGLYDLNFDEVQVLKVTKDSPYTGTIALGE